MSEEETKDAGRREGRLSLDEIKYITDNYEDMSVADIAGQLNRSHSAVRSYIVDKLHDGNKCLLEMQEKYKDFDIRRSPVWKDIQAQFNKDEQRKFLYHWANILGQFKYDVFSTERMQIVDVVRIEIMLDRSLVKIRDIQVVIDETKDSLTRERAKDRDAEDKEDRPDEVKIAQLQGTLADLYIANGNFQKDYKDYLEKKTGILKEIKGTRADRIKRIEDSKENLTTWIGQIVEDKDRARKLGRDMEMMRLAANAEYIRLSEYHKFADGEEEQPILTSESLKEDNT